MLKSVITIVATSLEDDIVPGVPLAGTWQIQTSFTIALGFGTVRSLAGFGDFGVRAFIAHVMDLRASISLEDV